MDLKRLSVLVCDPDGGAAAETKRDLKSLGLLRVETLTDGYAATLHLKKRPVDLLILKWNMPRMDGFEIVRYLGAIPRFEPPKVLLVLTREAGRERLAQLPDLGVDECLVAPYEYSAFKARIEKLTGAAAR